MHGEGHLNNSRHFDQYTTLKTLPHLLRSRKRHAPQHSSRSPPLSPLPPHSPRTPLCCTAGHKIAHFKAFFELVCAHMGPKCLRSFKRHATWHSTRTPHLSTPHPNPPQTLLCCTVSPKISHFKAFFERAQVHVGPRWLKMALNHFFEHPNRSRNTFGKNHFWPLLGP